MVLVPEKRERGEDDIIVTDAEKAQETENASNDLAAERGLRLGGPKPGLFALAMKSQRMGLTVSDYFHTRGFVIVGFVVFRIVSGIAALIQDLDKLPAPCRTLSGPARQLRIG